MPVNKKVVNNRYAANHPYSIGSSLIFHTRYVNLTEQVRATDPDHAAVVEKLARGEGISFEVLKTYTVLSSEDYADPESPWYEAPLVVTTNRDRFSLVHLSAIRFARSRGTVVLRWKSLHSLFRQRPADEHMEEMYKDPCFYEYFVAGAQCCLHATINRELGLVNSLPLVMHSLTMQNPHEHQQLIEAIANTEPGGVATIPAPLSMNVEVDTKYFTKEQTAILLANRVLNHDSDAPPAVKRRRLSRRKRSLPVSDDDEVASAPNYSDEDELSYSGSDSPVSTDSDKIVIPFLASGSKKREKVQVHGVKGKFRPCRVNVQQLFPIDLNFVITVNRSQGQTLGKVILALSERKAGYLNFKYAGLYVAFSRVKNKQDIRLLLCGKTEASRWNSVAYLTNLKPGPSFFAVIGGFKKKGGDGWMKDKWDKNRCKKLILDSKTR
jgi:hypothetical protein